MTVINSKIYNLPKYRITFQKLLHKCFFLLSLSVVISADDYDEYIDEYTDKTWPENYQIEDDEHLNANQADEKREQPNGKLIIGVVASAAMLLTLCFVAHIKTSSNEGGGSAEQANDPKSPNQAPLSQPESTQENNPRLEWDDLPGGDITVLNENSLETIYHNRKDEPQFKQQFVDECDGEDYYTAEFRLKNAPERIRLLLSDMKDLDDDPVCGTIIKRVVDVGFTTIPETLFFVLFQETVTFVIWENIRGLFEQRVLNDLCMYNARDSKELKKQYEENVPRYRVVAMRLIADLVKITKDEVDKNIGDFREKEQNLEKLNRFEEAFQKIIGCDPRDITIDNLDDWWNFFVGNESNKITDDTFLNLANWFDINASAKNKSEEAYKKLIESGKTRKTTLYVSKQKIERDKAKQQRSAEEQRGAEEQRRIVEEQQRIAEEKQRRIAEELRIEAEIQKTSQQARELYKRQFYLYKLQEKAIPIRHDINEKVTGEDSSFKNSMGILFKILFDPGGGKTFLEPSGYVREWVTCIDSAFKALNNQKKRIKLNEQLGENPKDEDIFSIITNIDSYRKYYAFTDNWGTDYGDAFFARFMRDVMIVCNVLNYYYGMSAPDYQDNHINVMFYGNPDVIALLEMVNGFLHVIPEEDLDEFIANKNGLDGNKVYKHNNPFQQYKNVRETICAISQKIYRGNGYSDKRKKILKEIETTTALEQLARNEKMIAGLLANGKVEQAQGLIEMFNLYS